jgi:circadian clock protein KaiB
MTTDQVAARLRIRLYVAGDAPNSVAASSNLRAVVAGLPKDRVELDVIDVLAAPERGLTDGVFITPMLVKVEPLPERRVLGTLNDRRGLLAALGLEEDARE